MRTTVTLEDDVFEAARALMRASGKTLGQVWSSWRGVAARLGDVRPDDARVRAAVVEPGLHT